MSNNPRRDGGEEHQRASLTEVLHQARDRAERRDRACVPADYDALDRMVKRQRAAPVVYRARVGSRGSGDGERVRRMRGHRSRRHPVCVAFADLPRTRTEARSGCESRSRTSMTASGSRSGHSNRGSSLSSAGRQAHRKAQGRQGSGRNRRIEISATVTEAIADNLQNAKDLPEEVSNALRGT